MELCKMLACKTNIEGNTVQIEHIDNLEREYPVYRIEKIMLDDDKSTQS
jgi:hypothetical protein